MRVKSLNFPIFERTGDAVEFGDTLADRVASTVDPDDAAMVSSAMRSLTPRQRDVLVKRYGLDGGGPCSFASIARDIGVTREAPRQIHDRAIKRIQSFIKTSQGA